MYIMSGTRVATEAGRCPFGDGPCPRLPRSQGLVTSRLRLTGKNPLKLEVRSLSGRADPSSLPSDGRGEDERVVASPFQPHRCSRALASSSVKADCTCSPMRPRGHGIGRLAPRDRQSHPAPRCRPRPKRREQRDDDVLWEVDEQPLHEEERSKLASCPAAASASSTSSTMKWLRHRKYQSRRHPSRRECAAVVWVSGWSSSMKRTPGVRNLRARQS